jgi:RNA polymerase sigma factor (sigma-70 family)
MSSAKQTKLVGELDEIYLEKNSSSAFAAEDSGHTPHMLAYVANGSPIRITADTPDVLLVAAAKDGDHQAYTELCRRHSKQVFRMVLRITDNIADAEDTLQEALLKAYIHIREFEGRSAFSSWLTRIAVNSALILLRRKRSQLVHCFENDPEAYDFKLPESMETYRSPEENCIQHALENELAQAIRYLPPNLRVVIQIRYRHDTPLSEIAKMLGISEAAVKSRLLRARLKIRAHLEKTQYLPCGIDPKALRRCSTSIGFIEAGAA